MPYGLHYPYLDLHGKSQLARTYTCFVEGSSTCGVARETMTSPVNIVAMHGPDYLKACHERLRRAGWSTAQPIRPVRRVQKGR